MNWDWLGALWDCLGKLLTDATFWTAVGALATIAAAFGIYLAGVQLRFDAWLKAQEIFVDEKFTKARGRVFRHLGSQPASLDLEDQEAGMLVCRRLDEFCRLAPYFAIHKSKARDVVLEVWDVPLGRLWGLLAPLVRAERDKVDWQKKWNSFQDLGGVALSRLSASIRKYGYVFIRRLQRNAHSALSPE